MSLPTALVAGLLNLARDAPTASILQVGAAPVATLSTVPPTIVALVPGGPLATAAMATSLATVAASITQAAAATASAQPGPGSPMDDDDNGECRLLGPFALLVQFALGGLALLALVYKRWRERPQRPVKIWFFDASKQVFGSALVHVANVFLSMLTSGRFSIKLQDAAVQTARMLLRRAEEDDYRPNPCSFYLLNLAIDTTIGIPILVFLLRICTGLFAYTSWGQPPESIRSGHYGQPPNTWWWLKQSVIYFCGLFGMKICVLFIFLMLPWISRVGDWALSWTEGNERLQIVFVMMLFPLIMNALQYYIIDSFIKGNEVGDEGNAIHGGGEDDDEAGTDSTARNSPNGYVAIARAPGDEADDDELDEGMGASKGLISSERETTGRRYDPRADGDSQTVVGSSSNVPHTRDQLLPKDLFPAE